MVMTELDYRPQGEFRVKAGDMAQAHKWLSLQAEIADDPLLAFGPMETDVLELGRTEFGEGGIKLLASGMNVNPTDGNYQLATSFITSLFQSPISIQAARQDNKLEIYAVGRNINFDRDKPEINLMELGQSLAIKLASKGYVVESDFSRQLVRIRKRPSGENLDDSLNNEDTEGWILHNVDDRAYSVFCLHTEAVLHEALQAFTDRVEKHAMLIEEVVKSANKSRGLPVPNTTYFLAPPKNIDRILQRKRAMLNARRKQLDLMGLGGDQLAEEVKQRMILTERPDVSFEDIGGLEKAKEELKTVIEAIQDPDSFIHWGTRPPRGVLLYGLPGTGKTLLAKALAHEAKATIFVVELADVIHHLYGKEQRIINAVFDQAQLNGPSIVFIDELDALASHRQLSDQITSQVVSVLSTRMDGLEQRNSHTVVIGATNRLDAIDSALLRPRRFDLLIEVPLPEDQVIVDIFKIHMGFAEQIAGRQLFRISPEEWRVIIKKATGLSGADIEELVRRALNRKVRQQRASTTPLGAVTMEEILKEIEDYESIRISKRGVRLGYVKD